MKIEIPTKKSMMHIRILFLALFFTSFNLLAQTETNDSIIYADANTAEMIYSQESSGWIIFNYEEEEQLLNLSNKDYVLWFNVNCRQDSIDPSFLIEYSDNYRDGNFGGLDFCFSQENNFDKIEFLIDEDNYKNPFERIEQEAFKRFISALKKGDSLTINFYDEEYDSETDTQELRLNRNIKFKLNNKELLVILIPCA